MNTREFLDLVAAEGARATAYGTYSHRLGGPIAAATLSRIQQQWNLPQDLVDLVRVIDGIHLWADQHSGVSHVGISPAVEWARADEKMYGSADVLPLPSSWLAISYDADSAVFIVLDTIEGGYFWMDSCGADKTCPIGAHVSDVLDWIWKHRGCPGVDGATGIDSMRSTEDL